jgi:UDP-glucose 4-epimerase
MDMLITGGAGFIGSHLTDALVQRGDSVTVLDDLSTGRRENLELALASGRAELIEGSTSDADLVDELVSECDAVFHLASAVGVQLIVDRSYESLIRNVRGTDCVLHAAARHRKRLLLTSTSEIYGKHSDGPLDEDCDRIMGPPQLSRWSYAISKSFGESLAYGLVEDLDAEIVVVRLFNTTGPRQLGSYGMVLPRFVRQALVGEPLTVHGDGRQTRCFAHVDDVVRGMIGLLPYDEAVGRPFNIGAGEETSMIELAGRVTQRAGSGSAIELVPYEEAYGEGFEELGRRRPDTSRIRALTGWAPRLSVDDAIDDVIEYERNRGRDETLDAVAS